MLNEKRVERIEEILERKQPMLQLFLDNVDSSQNISAITRSADAVGIFHLYYSNAKNAEVKTHKTITQGTHRWLEQKLVNSADKVTFLKAKQKEGFQIVATHLEAKSVSFRSIDYTNPTIIVVGNEKEGVSEEVLSVANEVIVIPMQGMAQSLNVSVATALILYEAERQLEEKGFYEIPQLSLGKRREIKEAWIYRDLISRRSKGRL